MVPSRRYEQPRSYDADQYNQHDHFVPSFPAALWFGNSPFIALSAIFNPND
jgi:hypothetical protein